MADNYISPKQTRSMCAEIICLCVFLFVRPVGLCVDYPMGWRWGKVIECCDLWKHKEKLNFPPSQGGRSSLLPHASVYLLATRQGRDKNGVIIHLHPAHKPFSLLTFLHSFLSIPLSAFLNLSTCYTFSQACTNNA